MKTTSRFAILAAAAAFASSASAADLGGNCCADLEERVAELEATTARKGNRNVSLTVYGHVNEMIMFWDDGVEKNAYVGTNDDNRSRFGFRGSARINSDWSAGYVMEFGLRTVRSDRWTAASYAAGGDPVFDVRRSAWYLDSKTFGRLTVGRDGTVDSGVNHINLSTIVAPHVDDYNDRFRIRGAGGGAIAGNPTWDRTMAPWSYTVPGRTRQNIIKYDSPTFAGFKFSANWGQDDYWAVALAYAAEFGGFRLAAKAAYAFTNEPGSEGGCTAGPAGVIDCEAWGVGAALMHVATGLHLSGSYGEQKDNLRPLAAVSDKDHNWRVTAGIEQRWFALGKTNIYGTYFYGENNQGFAGFDHLNQTMFTVGINQTIDAAAMDIYIAYYNAEAELSNAGVETPSQGFQAVITGARIRF